LTGPAVRPSAAQGEVHAESQFPRLLGSESKRLNELVRQEREIPDASLGVIQRDRVHRLHLEAADAPCSHQSHLSFQFRLGHCRAEPPPAHHDPGVVRRLLERALKLFYVGGWRHARHQQSGRHHQNPELPLPRCHAYR